MTITRRLLVDDEFRGSALPDVNLYADMDISQAAEDHSRQLRLLISAITNLPVIAKAKRFDVYPSRDTMAAAIDFAKNLPSNRMLPRVAPDDDGDILMVWHSEPGGCAITFEGAQIHMVVNPGHASTHLKPTFYEGGQIPSHILNYIPVRR